MYTCMYTHEASFYLCVSAPKLLFTGPNFNFTASINNFSEAGRRVREDTGKREEDLAVTLLAMAGREEDMSNHRAKLKPTVLLLTDCYSEGRPNDK